MRSFSVARLLALGVIVAGLIGCGGQQPAAHVEPPDNGPVTPASVKPATSQEANTGGPVRADRRAGQGEGISADALVKLLDLPDDKLPQPSRDERYDNALLEALGQMAERKYGDALAALEKARTAQDTEQVRLEIDKVKKLSDEQKAAEQTGRDIQAVLDDGKAEEAARLASAALQQYGGGDSAGPLALLNLQADALAAIQIDDAAARRARFAREGDDALRDKNFRAAVVAYEQALQAGEDPNLRQRHDGVQDVLALYDQQRRRARELRRDPANLEEALAALQTAARYWDTSQVRQDIDECTLALQMRRDRISVADFEVRGDIGLPAAGRTIAETLLPAFRPRFDLVEREQVGKVLDELRVEASDVTANDEARQQVGRLARVRYLVVGSVSPLSGLTVNARLVELQTGLVVQTARLIASDPDDLVRRLPKLAVMLQMTDDQRTAFEAELAQAAAAEVSPAVLAPLPPPPPVPVQGVVVVAPLPIIVYTPRPAPFGGLVFEDFDRLPAEPPPERAAFSFDLLIARDNPVKDRMLSVSVELGDNLFRRGRYREAQRHFELAFSLSKGHEEIAVRLERCRQLAPPPPPPPVVVVAAPTVVVMRPRIAVFNFLVDAPPGLVPAGCDNWAADQLAGCFASQYEVVDRGEVCWWMGRLGLTMRDVLNDPTSRFALAQSLNVRFFVFGGMRHTASFDVTTHMVDAQTGVRTGGGTIHVQDTAEMKLRLTELVGQTTGTPAQAKQLAQDGRDSEKVLAEARQLLQAGKFAEASAVARAGLQKYPTNVALKTVQAQAERQVEQARVEEARRQEAAQQAVQAEATRKQQQELARQAEAARLRAQEEAKRLDAAGKRAQEAQKQQAFDNLVAQARAATRAGNAPQAVSLYDSALAFKPDPAAARERDQAKASAAQAAKTRADAEKALRDAVAQKQREAALVVARAQVDAEKKQRDAVEAEQRQAQATHDATELARLIDQAKGYLAKGQYAAAMGAVQTAQRLQRSDEIERLAAQVQEAQARTDAEKKGPQAKADLENQLAADKAARDKADAEARQKQAQDAKAREATAARDEADKAKRQADYAQAMKAGRDAYMARRFDDSVKAFSDAARLMPGDRDATACLQQVTKVRDDMKAATDAEAKRRADYTRLMNQGQTALTARRYDEALKAYTDALKLQPGDAAATRGQRDAQQGLDAARGSSKPPPPPPPPPAEYTRQMDAALALEKQQKYADAVPAYKAALRALPNDSKATTGADFAQHVADGQKAQAARKFPDAIREYEAALKLIPNHPDATAFLKRAREGKP